MAKTTIKITKKVLRDIINESVKRILSESDCNLIKESINNPQTEYDPYKDMPKLSSLPNGTYNGLYYGYVFELKDGKKFKTSTGVRCGRDHCGGYKNYKVENGELIRLH